VPVFFETQCIVVAYMSVALRRNLFRIWKDGNIRRNNYIITTSGYWLPSLVLDTRWHIARSFHSQP